MKQYAALILFVNVCYFFYSKQYGSTEVVKDETSVVEAWNEIVGLKNFDKYASES